MKYNNSLFAVARRCVGIVVVGLLTLVGGGVAAQSNVVVSGNVFGGGNAAAVSGSTSVLMQGNALVENSVYGGGALANTGTYANSNTTTVTIEGGTVGDGTAGKGNVFGGALGDASHAPDVNGTVTVHIGTEAQVNNDIANNVVIKGSVFGCNNAYGTPRKAVTVHIWRTKHTAGTDEVADAGFALQNVFGGGNQAHYTPTASQTASVIVHTCDNTIANLYGGGNAANVGVSGGTAAHVLTEIHGGRLGWVFGGGNGAGVSNPGANIYGNATLTVHAGIIEHLFGGSNEKGTITGTKNMQLLGDGACAQRDITEVYGGNNMAPGTDASLTISCPTAPATPWTIASVFGGSRAADLTGDVVLNIEGGTFGDVYGGNNQSGVIGGTVELNLYGGTIDNAFGGNNAGGSINGVITVNVDSSRACPLVVNNVYGGGNLASYDPTGDGIDAPLVNVKNGTVSESVYGGGYGTAAVVTANPQVTVGDNTASHYARVLTNVFGGGALANVEGDPTVTIKNANSKVYGSVFGAGEGVETTGSGDQAVALVKGNTTVNMTAGLVKGNIYGGGKMASVGEYTYSGNLVTGLTSGGATTVTVSGGTVGVSDQGNAVHDSKATAGRTPNDKGHVFGGGLGLPGTDYDGFAYVDAPTVVISGGTVVGSVFGGGENGHVSGNTSVTVSGGTVGMDLSSLERIEENGDGIDVYFGNVYGGGRGIDNYGTANPYSNNAGRVEGNTMVTISGGKVQRNVYGGGSLASVGDNTSGTATVNIQGGMVGTMGWNEGSVFGGCRGVVNADPAVETLIANVYRTAVNIKPGASIMGSVFGGGANGHVLDTTLVSITGGIVGHPLEEADTLTTIYGYAPRTVFRGNVYGGGRGVTPLPGGGLSTTAGRVYGNTHVEMTDGWVRHSVFGGGSMASVGTYTTDGAGDIATCTAGGRAWVEITGGYVGTQSKTFNYSTESGDGKTYEAASDGKGGTIPMVMGQGGEGRNNGRVFGSCRGTAGEDYDHLAYVNITRVIIGTYGSATGPHIMGCVFGSGENGHVLDSTYVQMHSGDIGRGKVYDWKRTYIGNLYGGGRGIDFDKNNKLSKTAGWVRGSTRVEMTGGHVWHNIYGGGSLASVGELVDNPTYTPVPDIDNRHGRTTVHIVGGKVGRDGLFGGNVFGSGRGRAGLNVDTVFHLCSNECTYLNKGTNVTIGGTSRAVWTLRNRANTADSLWLARIPSVLNATVDSIYYVLNDAHTDADTVQHDFSHLTNVHNAQVIINYAAGNSDTSLHRICGSVYGSGDNGHVLNRTYVGIHGGTIGNRMTFADDAARTAYLNKYPAADRANISANIASNGMVLVSGSVYGSGRGLDLTNVGNQMSPSAGRVYGHTTVNVTGGHVMRNVYGGGNMAGVGEGTRNASGELVSSHATAGTTTVTITGGTIGKEYNEVKDAARGQWGGNVFGSSRGLSANDVHVKNMAFVRETKVDIKDGVAGSTVDPAHKGKADESVFTVTTTAGHATIYGSVFGGGENGHVWHNTDVVIDGNVTIGYAEVASIAEPVYPGNVYGGGRGIDLTDASHVSRTSGAVYGNTHVTIKGGTIYHNVFGGGSLASVGRYIFYNNASEAEKDAAEYKVADYVIRLAEASDFQAGGAYAAITPGIDTGWGKSYVTILGGTIGVNAVNNGRVFGAGRGIAGQDGTGNAFNYYTFVDQTLVNIKGGQINGCVFGSGDNGHVSGNTVVNVSGGTIGYSNGGPVNGNVFGSGRGADRGYKAGESGNNWYSPTAGRVRGNTQVNITGGTIKNNVYGGGFMASVKGNTEVNIGTEAGGPADFAIWGDVFGGSALGAIGTAGNTTTVNILSGTIGSTSYGYNAGHKGNIFGGGNGDAGASSATEAVTVYVDGDPSATVNSREADVLNTVQVNIGHTSQYGDASKGATILGNVFGCNNIAGSPKADVHVDVYSTAHVAGDGISTGNVYPTGLKAKAADVAVLDTNDVNALTAAEKTSLLDETRFALGEVYGGGNKADYVPALASNTTGVTIHECEENTIKYVYGGGRAADIGNNTLAISTTVYIEGGHIKQVFAGGDGHTQDGGGNYLAANIWGNATLEIEGGLIEQAFGGSNTTGRVYGTARVNFSPVSACRLMLDEAFGGGNHAEGGSTVVTIPCGFSGSKVVYGGANEARIVGDVTLNIEGGTLARVFGGSKSADITGDVTVNVYGGSIDELFGGNDEGGNIAGTIEVNVDWGLNSCPDDTLLRYVYGGGYKAPYAPNSPYTATTSGEVTNFTPVVNIIQATVDTAVFGGGFGVGTDALTDAHIDANPKVVIGAYRVKDHAGNTIDAQPNNHVRIGKGKNELGRTLAGNVFGGGNAGPVNGSPKVVIQGSDTKVWHNVYGGGNAAMVKGNPDVEIGGNVMLSVPKVTQSGNIVTLTSREGATIHYTTDGSTPTTSSATYSTPLTGLANGTVVKAIAHKDDFKGPTKISGVISYTVTE